VQGDEGLVRQMEIFAPKQQVQLEKLSLLAERKERRRTVAMSSSERTEMLKRHHMMHLKKDVIPYVESQSADGEVVLEEVQHGDDEEGEQEPERTDE